jgi:hypothetical protein
LPNRAPYRSNIEKIKKFSTKFNNYLTRGMCVSLLVLVLSVGDAD